MFQKLDQSTGNIVGIRISGTLTKEDYERLLPELEQAIDAYDEINLLCHFDGFTGMEPGAIWEDLKFDANHLRDVARCAIVKDADWQGWLGRLTGPLAGAEVRIYDPAQIDEAWAWLRSAGKPATSLQTNGHDPRYHARRIQRRLDLLIDHLRRDVQRVDDPRGEALFETTAEVLQGLSTAFEHFEQRTEEAWQEGRADPVSPERDR